MTNVWELQYGFRRKSLYRSVINMPDLDIIKRFMLNLYEMCSCHIHFKMPEQMTMFAALGKYTDSRACTVKPV